MASVQNYGAFICIPGNKNQGLVHRSQVSSVPVDDATEVLQRGERVWCKVINISVSFESYWQLLIFINPRMGLRMFFPLLFYNQVQFEVIC